MYLVDRIIERCENSSRDWREGVTGGRTLRITQEDYDACGKEELIEEVQRLERAGLLTVKKWVVPDRYRICPAGILRLNDRNIDLYQNS